MQRMNEIINIRRTEHTDIPKLESLITTEICSTFGRTNLLKVIERSILSLTLTRQNDTVVGGACFHDHPDRHITTQEDWEQWFHVNIGIPNVTSINSLFIRVMVLESAYEKSLPGEICRTVFSLLNDVQNILILSNEPCALSMIKNFPFNPICHTGSAKKISVYVAYRHEVFPVLYSRIATVEDNDDIAPLFNEQTDLLRNTYGNFYIAELVAAQNDNLKCVVVESNRHAVGFISATRDVNLEQLNISYDLDLFNGLHKVCPNDQFEGVDEENTLRMQDNSYLSKEEQIIPPNSNKGCVQSISSVSEMTKPIPWTRRHILSKDLEATSECKLSKAFYTGPPDAFAIQLYAIKPGFESRFIDMLPLLFDQFPGLNYAVISVPRTVPVFPLLQHFVHCRIRTGEDPEYELYVFHRDGLLRDFHVRRTKHTDTEQIEKLIQNLNPTDQVLMLQDLKAFMMDGRDQNGIIINSFVAEAMDRIVGLAIIRDYLHIEWIRAHYDIEDYIYFSHHARNEHATLNHYVLAANFSCRKETFLKEILRQANKTCLYYVIMPPYAPSSLYNKTTLITCLSSLYAVRPRHQIVYPSNETLGVKQPEDRLLESLDALPALFMGTAKLFTEPKVVINARIIVVGASTTGLAVLETLAGCSFIRFTNLVLLSTHGLPGDTLNRPDEDAMKFLTTDYGYSLEELGQLALRHSVHVIHGKLTAIDRKFKKITIDRQRKLSYDYLVLTTGLQYHTCCPNGADIQELTKTSEAPFLPTRRFSYDYPQGTPPKNLFLINNIHDATAALQWVRTEYLRTLHTEGTKVIDSEDQISTSTEMQLSTDDSTLNEQSQVYALQSVVNGTAKHRDLLVVYGYSLDAYTCVAALLQTGVPGNCIVMIHPPRSAYQRPAFNDPEVEKFVHTHLAGEEILIGRDFSLAQWNGSAAGDVEQIEVLTFTSEGKPLKLFCKGLFCFHEKTVDYDLFNATNDACLIFDSRVVVDVNFHTNDPAIRAAGPVTKLQRIYYDDLWRHELCNSREVGRKLGQLLLESFNPSQSHPIGPVPDCVHLLPQFIEPKIVGCQLPGGYTYLCVTKPSLPESLEKRKQSNSVGRFIQTGKADEGNGYFKLHINQYQLVQSVVCLTKKKFPASNYIRLYNVHERLLNNLVSRFDEGLIPDLFDFLNDVWPLAIYHDRFDDFLAEVRDLLHTCPPNAKESIAQTVHHLLASTGEVKPSELAELKATYVKDGYKRAVEQRLLSFINFNYNLLPMYAKPDMV